MPILRRPLPPAAVPLALALLAAPIRVLPAQATGDEPAALAVAAGEGVRVTLGGYLQADGRWVAGGASDDGVLLRRARLVVDVATRGGWSLRLQPDFGRGRALLQDGFVAWRLVRDRAPGGAPGAGVPPRRPTTLDVRVGRFRPAFGVERTQSSATLLFPERSLLNAFMPSRLAGVQGMVTTGRLTASAGAYGAAASDVAVDTDGDPTGPPIGGRDVVARLVVRPLGTGGRSPAPVELHLGAMLGHERGTAETPGLERFLTPGQRPALAYRTDADGTPGTRADGGRGRLMAGAQGVVGRWHLLVEGARVHHAVRLGERGDRLVHDAGALRLTWLAGGRRTAELEVEPAGPRGAVELGARAAAARFDPDARAFAMPGAARRMGGGGAAVAWVPRSGTRLSASYDVTRLRRHPVVAPAAPPRRVERALLLRVQQGF